MWLGELWRSLRFVARRNQFDRELEEEIRLHLDLRAAGYTEDGPNAARRKFGNTTQCKENSREMWNLGTAIATMLQDARYAARSFAKARGFSLVAVATL